MQRRDFIKRVVSASAVALASYGKVMADEQGKTKSDSEKKKPSSNQGKIKKIDMFSHFVNAPTLDVLEDLSGQRPHFWRAHLKFRPALGNIDLRLQIMDKGGIEQHVLVPSPVIEIVPSVYADPKLAAQAARVYNDEIAKAVAQSPKRFLGVAFLPINNTEIMMAEFERAINELGFVGTLIHVGPTLKPPDHQDYEPLYRKSADMGVPIWIHPFRPDTYPDYVGETESKWAHWQSLGWLMDTSTAMTRLVFHGVFDRYPNLKLITHHAGALIPVFKKRMQSSYDQFIKAGVKYDTTISKPYINHFRKFYCDTATQGVEPLLLKLASDFFGVDHVLFGTDFPYDTVGGEDYTKKTIESVEELSIPEADRRKIYNGNALSLLKRV